MKWVVTKEKEIDFGAGKPWSDVEADEATFDRKDLATDAPDPSKCVFWEQWCGPSSDACIGCCSSSRARGHRNVEWKPIAEKWLQNKKVILHTDAAKSHRARVPGVLHDNVVRCKQRVKVKGKWRSRAKCLALRRL